MAGQQDNNSSMELMKRQLQMQQAALQAVQEQQQKLLSSSGGNLVTVAPPVDDLKRKADEMFDLYDTSQNGLMDVEGLCRSFCCFLFFLKKAFICRVCSSFR